MGQVEHGPCVPALPQHPIHHPLKSSTHRGVAQHQRVQVLQRWQVHERRGLGPAVGDERLQVGRSAQQVPQAARREIRAVPHVQVSEPGEKATGKGATGLGTRGRLLHQRLRQVAVHAPAAGPLLVIQLQVRRSGKAAAQRLRRPKVELFVDVGPAERECGHGDVQGAPRLLARRPQSRACVRVQRCEDGGHQVVRQRSQGRH